MASRFGDEFNAFGLVPLVQNTPFKISSLASYNDHVYVGTKDGRVVVFRNVPGSAELLSARLHRSKPVTTLLLAGPLQRALALCGGKLYVLDLYTLQRSKTIETAINKRIRGATVFCIDRAGPPLWRLCFGVKRKLVLFEHGGTEWTFLKELALPESASAMCWFGPSICVGYKREYNIIKVDTGQTIKAGPVLDNGDEPYLKVLPGPHIIAGGMAEVGVLLDLSGNPTSGVVGWSGDVNSSVYTYPYLASLVQTKATDKGGLDSAGGDGSGGSGAAAAAAGLVGGLFGGGGPAKSLGSRVIEVHSVIDQYKLVQTIQVPPDAVTLVECSDHLSSTAATKASRKNERARRSSLRASQAPRSGTGPSPMMSVAAHTTSQLFFASATAIYQINMIAISKQVSQLLRLVRVEAALNLLKATTLSKSVVQRERVLAQFSQDAGVTLFVNLMFKEAAPHLCASYMDLRELLQLFPELQPIGGIGVEFEPSVILPRSRGGTLPDNVANMAGLIRRMRGKHKRIASRNSVMVLDGGSLGAGAANANALGSDDQVLADARQCMLEVFEDRRRRVLNGEFEEEVMALQIVGGSVEEDGLSASSASAAEGKSAARDDAFSGLIGPDQRLLDTCIFNLYATMSGKLEALEAFVQENNAVQLQDATGVLQRKQLFHALALLNANKGRSREALEIWMRIGSSEYNDASGRHGVKETVKFLCNLGNGELSSSADDAKIDPEDAMVAEDDSHLVWTFASWVLRASPADGIKIFTHSKRPRELPPDRVLEFLSSFLADGGVGVAGTESAAEEAVWPREARVAFLEYLIRSEGGAEQHYHTQLALELVHMTVHALAYGSGRKNSVDNDDSEQRARLSSGDFGSIGAQSDLADRLSNPGGRAAMQKQRSNSRHGRRRSSKSSSYGKYPPVRRKLLNLLRAKDSHYNNAKLLTATTGKGLHEERVLLLGHAGSHIEALRILVFELRDLGEAERYCAEHSPSLEKDPSHARGLFLPLINLYMERGDQRTAMDLLRRHAPHIDPIQALSQLPEMASLATMQPFLQSMLRHSTHRKAQALISKNLAKTRNLNVRCDLAALETRAIVVTQSTVCCVCGYSIMPNTVFVVFPAGEIAHLKCCQRGLDVHPLPPHEPLKSQNREKAFLWKLMG